MADDKKVEIVKRLIRQTREGKLSWQETADPSTFQVSFPNSAIQLSRTSTDLNDDIVISVLNASGRGVEHIYWTDLLASFDNPREVLEQLYDVARRIAVGVDTILDDVISELGGPSKGR